MLINFSIIKIISVFKILKCIFIFGINSESSYNCSTLCRSVFIIIFSVTFSCLYKKRKKRIPIRVYIAYRVIPRIVIQNNTAITKAGNSRVRQLLIESAKSIKYGRLCSAKSKRLIQRQEGKSPLVIQYADMAIARIRHKMLSMERKGLHYNVITTAAARELSCFIWGMMTGNISRTSV